MCFEKTNLCFLSIFVFKVQTTMVRTTSLSCLAAVFALRITAWSAPSSSIKWVDCAKNVPESSEYFNTSAIDLSNLPSNLHCGQIAVPMDYSKAFSDTNMITLGLGMYRPSKPKGALFQYDPSPFPILISILYRADICRFSNPGGTDAGVILAWEIALNYTNAFNELLDFDILGNSPSSYGYFGGLTRTVMDVRGTYSSNPLNVSIETFAGLQGP